jgi:PP-loop superfamily ATP-utilizing enzyme
MVCCNYKALMVILVSRKLHPVRHSRNILSNVKPFSLNKILQKHVALFVYIDSHLKATYVLKDLYGYKKQRRKRHMFIRHLFFEV